MFKSRCWTASRASTPPSRSLIYAARHRRAAARRSSSASASPTRSASLLGGYAVWTLTEYWLHRVVFHFEPEHGPRRAAALDDPRRPPRPPERPAAARHAAVGLACRSRSAFCRAVLARARRATARTPFGAGFLAGYLAYDMIHYHVHHHRPRTPRRAAGCASCTCATTSRTTSAASASARRTGTASSARAADARALTRRPRSRHAVPSVTDEHDSQRRRATRPRSSTACPSSPTARGVLEPAAAPPVPAVQAAALAATGFVAGAATVAVVAPPPRQAARAAAQEEGRDRRDRLDATRSWSTSTCCAAIERSRPGLTRRSICASRSTPPWPFRLGRGSRRRDRCAAAARRCSGCCTCDGEPVLVAVAQPAPRPRAVRAPARPEPAAAWGDRADALRDRRRRRPARRSTSASATTR